MAVKRVIKVILNRIEVQTQTSKKKQNPIRLSFYIPKNESGFPAHFFLSCKIHVNLPDVSRRRMGSNRNLLSMAAAPVAPQPRQSMSSIPSVVLKPAICLQAEFHCHTFYWFSEEPSFYASRQNHQISCDIYIIPADGFCCSRRLYGLHRLIVYLPVYQLPDHYH